MFGLDATEMMVLVIVGIIVVGPKKLPEMMRTAGKWVAKLRRMSSSLRSQSGIDEILRIEGLEKEMRELRALTRINVMDTLASVGERQLPVRAPRQIGASGGGSDSKLAKAIPASASPAASKPAPKLPAASAPAPIPTDDAAPTDMDATSEATVVKPAGEPPPGVVPRSKPRPVVLIALPGEVPLVEREWPSGGCDAYDALPDDLDESEEELAEAARTDAARTDAASSISAETTGPEPTAVATTGDASPEHRSAAPTVVAEAPIAPSASPAEVP